MADNIFNRYGGKIKFTPERVRSELDTPEYAYEDQVRNIGLQRDLTAANLLEMDVLLDALDAAIDDQMKEFLLDAPEIRDAAMNLCGSPTVNWECYKKAKELLRIAPWVAYGYDPVQATFTDKFSKRAGNVVFDCKQFDPNTFHKSDLNLNDEFDPSKIIEEFDTETATEVQAKAEKNQKKWAMLVLFWDLLWGKAVIKPGITDVTNGVDANQQSIEQTKAEIEKLRSEGKNEAADILAKRLSDSKNLPNTIMEDRPRLTNQLQWADKNNQPIESNLNLSLIKHFTKTLGVKEMKISPSDDDLSSGKYPWHDNASAAWIDFASLFTARDHYKDKSIPAIKSGFILSILIGFLALPPKVAFFFIKKRFEFLRSIKWMKTKKYFGIKLLSPIHDFLKALMDGLTAIPAMINTIFLEICIWLALIPNMYVPNVSDLEDIKQPNTGLQTFMSVEPTPAGFVSMDCFTAAQQILNRVNMESITDE